MASNDISKAAQEEVGSRIPAYSSPLLKETRIE
jgi:hypothetical protein